MRTFSVDLSRFTCSGHGTLHNLLAVELHPGERIAVSDDDADIVDVQTAREMTFQTGASDWQKWAIA